MRGSAGTEFEGGIYHFRIQLPSEYPFRPPSIMLMTPNGRFELNTKASNHSILYLHYYKLSWPGLHQFHQLYVVILNVPLSMLTYL